MRDNEAYKWHRNRNRLDDQFSGCLVSYLSKTKLTLEVDENLLKRRIGSTLESRGRRFDEIRPVRLSPSLRLALVHVQYVRWSTHEYTNDVKCRVKRSFSRYFYSIFFSFLSLAMEWVENLNLSLSLSLSLISYQEIIFRVYRITSTF